MTHMLQILGLACLTAATPASGATDGDVPRVAEASSEEDAAAVAPAPTAPASGLRVVVDPETGRIVDEPTSAQIGRPSEGLVAKRRPSEELRSFSLPGGGKGVFLDGWADHSLAIEVSADGKMKSVCSQGDQHGAQEPQESPQR